MVAPALTESVCVERRYSIGHGPSARVNEADTSVFVFESDSESDSVALRAVGRKVVVAHRESTLGQTRWEDHVGRVGVVAISEPNQMVAAHWCARRR